MGGTIGRVAMGAATMGMSENVRAGMGLMKATTSGGDVLGSLADAASFGGAGAAKGIVQGSSGDQPTNGDLPSPSELSSERSNVKKKRAALASTLLTGARGVLGEAPVSSASLIGGRKTLG